jgi:hypothetical protein
VKYNWWSLYWLVWVVVLFGVPEFWAILSGHDENTLSYQVWNVEGQGSTLARYFVASFLVWLFLHMVFRAFK